MIPMYEPLETSKCGKCVRIAEPKEFVRIVKNVYEATRENF